MSAEALAEALIALHELTPEERELLRGATEALPDGEPRKVLVARGMEGEVEAMNAPRPGVDAGYWAPGQARAVEYVRRNLSDPDLRARFTVFMAVGDDVVP